jgi:uncharacterized protein YndB with AHSA1/START domain
VNLKVERTITIAAPREKIWKAWVHEMNGWWTRPYYNDHDHVTGLYMEPQLGGRYIEKWGEDGSGFLIGHITEWLPIRLAYTWSERTWAGVTTLIRIELESEGEGATRLTFIPEGFERLPEAELTRGVYRNGCDQLLERLKNYIEKGNPA